MRQYVSQYVNQLMACPLELESKGHSIKCEDSISALWLVPSEKSTTPLGPSSLSTQISLYPPCVHHVVPPDCVAVS